MTAPPSTWGLNETHQIREVSPDRIRGHAQLFSWEIEAIDPERGVPKPLGPSRIPTRKRHEENILARELKRVHRQLIRPRIRFVRTYLIGAQDVSKNALQVRI
jgi:hypothetical protein